MLIFHHGGGAHSGAGYPHLAAGLRDEHRIAVYTPDLRGHGASGGPRGDAPSAAQLWRDVDAFVAHVHRAHPGVPLFLGGHSSGAGLALNHATRRGAGPVAGYVFLSPHLGHRSRTGREPRAGAPRERFAEARVLPFVGNAMSGGRLLGHVRAVRFRYPATLLAADPGLVGWNTVNVANAVSPAAPRQQMRALERPFGLWIGADDEIFAPERVLAHADRAVAVRAESRAEIVPDRNHLGILVDAHRWIGPWIASRAGGSEGTPGAAGAVTPCC